MPEYELIHSLDSEHECLNTSMIRTNGAKKAIFATNENLQLSAREKTPVSRFGYHDQMAYHYAFMMKVAIVQELETFFEATKDPRWIEAMNEELKVLCKNKIWDLVPRSLLVGYDPRNKWERGEPE